MAATLLAPSISTLINASNIEDVISVGFTAGSTQLTVRAIHFDHLMPRGLKHPEQPEPIRAGSFNPHLCDRTVAAQPPLKSAKTKGRCREWARGEQPAPMVDNRGDVNVEVRINTPVDDTI